jgi:hypothetical protein
MPHFFDPPDEPCSLRGSKSQFAYAEKPKPVLDARKVDHAAARQGEGIVTYSVTEIAPKPKGQDRRDPPRKRTRLRCGKILDQRGKFLIECQVHDRSAHGAQLRLMGAVALPRHIRFFDDEQGALVDAEVIWRRKDEIGVQFRTKIDGQAVRSGRRSALGGKYYAVT